MTYDPMRQADIQRRLANMAKAPRCGAKTRAGHPCRQASVRGDAQGAECTAGRKAQAGLAVIATAISGTGYGHVRT
jgi:ribosomal protein L32